MTTFLIVNFQGIVYLDHSSGIARGGAAKCHLQLKIWTEMFVMEKNDAKGGRKLLRVGKGLSWAKDSGFQNKGRQKLLAMPTKILRGSQI